MRKALAIICLASIGLFSSIAVARSVQKEDPVQMLIKAAKFLEENPLEKDAKNVRGWAIGWVIETDKVTVNVCSLILSVEKKYKYSSELVGQYTIGMAAFKLANPEKASDDGAAQLAGVESAIRSYEAIVKVQPKATSAVMDQLVAKRADGSLAQYVAQNNCKEKK